MTTFVTRITPDGQLTLLSAESAALCDGTYEEYSKLEATSSWGEFRREGYPFEIAELVIGQFVGGGSEAYIAAVEMANGLEVAGSPAERWTRVTFAEAGPAAAGNDSDIPQDDWSFDYQSGDDGADAEYGLCLMSSMAEDLPGEVVEEFELGIDSTLDGYLAAVESDQMDAVTARLVELGDEVR